MKQHQNIKNAHVVLIKPSIEKAAVTYICTNHREIILSSPGNCTECGKSLVKKYNFQ